MKHIRLPSGNELFIGQPGDGFLLGKWKPKRPNAIDSTKMDESEFRLECHGNVFDISHGADADAMRYALAMMDK